MTVDEKLEKLDRRDTRLVEYVNTLHCIDLTSDDISRALRDPPVRYVCAMRLAVT